MFLGLIGLVTVDAKSSPAQSVHQANVIQPKSTSPFEIARVVSRSKRIWSKSHVVLDVDLGETWKSLGIDSGNFAGCSGDCEAAIYRHDLDPAPGREVILKLTQSHNSCRYLIFFRTKGKPAAKLRWKLRGYIDHDFNRYEMASHHVVHAFGKNWLVIRGQEGSGSGYYLYGETWLEVSERGIRPVLHYSVDGHTDPGLGGVKWELKSRAMPLSNSGARASVVKLSFIVGYTAEGFEGSDFTRRFVDRRNAYYVWNKRKHEFIFTGHRSTISEREMNLIANIETESTPADEGVKIGESTFYSGLKGFVGSGFEMFLRLNIHRLMRIARGTSGPDKKWLRGFLKQCDDIPEKLTLERALDQLPQARKQR
jgi:hypothetical protein